MSRMIAMENVASCILDCSNWHYGSIFWRSASINTLAESLKVELFNPKTF
jgi:hypothetical protein